VRGRESFPVSRIPKHLDLRSGPGSGFSLSGEPELWTPYTIYMCGRYRLTRADKELAREFGIDLEAEAEGVAWAPRYNIAPTDVMPVVELDAEGKTCFRMKRWGLIPFWAKDEKIGASMINARSETVLEKPALAESFRRHRVLVPFDPAEMKRYAVNPAVNNVKNDSPEVIKEVEPPSAESEEPPQSQLFG
jgi:putative SOS response-associated peptidase YedK